MIVKMNINQKYIWFIKNGKKKIEVRLYDEKRRRLKRGDIILVNNGDLKLKVKDIRTYNSFRELLLKEGFKNVIPMASSLEEALRELYNIYSPEEEKKWGVVAIEIEPIQDISPSDTQ
ncbi:MAG: ASCH domain-containing protein [Thermococcus sp.]|uniref:ASCH domain-containing protein n=1 Tax=Thermococcus sp. TaxID=35749 RepID=UPI001D6167CD|nr:ASCH domain-containing protein [Thermococcus sp.]MBO8175292.1 ASCH domain-containing protein [Thermococcus sp.]